jgi:hypothetical protein
MALNSIRLRRIGVRSCPVTTIEALIRDLIGAAPELDARRFRSVHLTSVTTAKRVDVSGIS